MTTTYDKFLAALREFSKSGKIQILHRGLKREDAFKKFNLDTKHNTLEQFGERLFFFGEKSRNFQIGNKNLKVKINDTSTEVFKKIFEIYLTLATEYIPADFYNLNKDKFAFFDVVNQNSFLKNINELSETCKVYLRNYYFLILHQLDYNDFKEISLLLSSSPDELQAANHSIGKNGIKINFWQRNKIKPNCDFKNLPIFIGTPHPEENEESIFGAIFPHYIYSFECEGKIFINPNIPDLDDYDVIFYAGFDIDQSDFKEKLKKMTSYQSYLENNNGTLEEI
ncbi:hypothetical protein ACNFU2_07020 [Chryseobacterium sp. PTM-20240506]|uniref:hypothetical protein n=1 Tax=Chryseobacterium sp. PTM-20240506 TaxID=3400631 RepID=UPI003AAA3F92